LFYEAVSTAEDTQTNPKPGTVDSVND